MAPAAPAKQDFPSLGEYAYERLRTHIREGALPPGTRVREAEVAGQLGISRTPVREALRRLEADGFLTFEPHRGMVVVQLDHQSVMELYAMREALEGTAAGLAAQHAHPHLLHHPFRAPEHLHRVGERHDLVHALHGIDERLGAKSLDNLVDSELVEIGRQGPLAFVEEVIEQHRVGTLGQSAGLDQ